MADNSTVGTPVGTGDTIRDKDRAGVKTQIVGLDLNIGGAETLMTGAMPSDLTTTAVADGGTLPAKGVQVGGTDGSVFQVLSTDAAGRLNTNINGTVPVSGGLTDTQLRASAVPVDTELPAAAALADGTANPTTSVIEAMLGCYNGTTWDRVRGDTTNGLFVNVKTSVLPTGASTSAKQPTLGTAGAASADVITVQGVASMTALKVDGSAVTQPVSGTVTANLSSANVTNAGTFAVQDSQKVVDNAGFTDGTTPVNPVGFVFDEVAGTALTENDAAAARIDAKRAQVLVVEDATTRGQRAAVSAAGRISVDASGVAVPITDNAGSLTVDAPVGTPAFVRLSDGAAAITTLPTSLATLPALTAGSAQIGTTSLTPQTSGGLTTFHLVSAASTNATSVKAGVGQLYGWFIRNLSAGDRKVAFHNTAGTPTAGSGVVFSLNIPAGGAANVFGDIGIPFATGIAISTVTGAADTDATAVGLNDLDINLWVK